MEAKNGFSIEAPSATAASISSMKDNASASTRSPQQKDRAQETSAAKADCTVLLFDIDGTLVLTGGAGMRAMAHAFQDVFSIANAFDGIAMPGRTDTIILADAVRRHGIAADDPRLSAFRARYLARLAEHLEPPHPHKRVMPGVRALLDVLSGQDDIFLALLTGNFAEAAEIKLSHFDLWRYFRCGAYGEDASDRNVLVPVALARARASGCPHVTPGRVVVVGDTPHDVACAAAAGARSIAVATGSSSRAQLIEAGADVVLDDLSDTDAVVSLLQSFGHLPEKSPPA
jgi:phosphoglycolate phosphatase-like HAD superfamily hydrolase